MRRVTRTEVTGAGVVPKAFTATPIRSLFRSIDYESPANAGCWRCPDSPCVRFSQAELTREVSLPSPLNPEVRVCPTDALSRSGDSPVVDVSKCIGCGLCVVRCPVGATHLDADTALPIFAPPVSGALVPEPAFSRARALAGKSIHWEIAPFANADEVLTQLKRASSIPSTNQQLAFRLLVRNAFLASGDAARLSITGDTSAWAEVAAGMAQEISLPLKDQLLAAVQIEPGDVGLDALRRLMSGVARAIARHGVEKSSLVPIVVVTAQPNSRTDYYRLVSDASQFLNLTIRTIPLATLLLAIRDRSASMLKILSTGDLGLVDAQSQSNASRVAEAFGVSTNLELGLSPKK